MDDYIERVMKAASARTGEPVFNGSIDHARVIATAMFKHARQNIDILSTSLNARVYGPEQVIDEAKLFLADKSHCLRILLEKSPDDASGKHPFFDEFKCHSNVHVRELAAHTSEILPFHMIVADQDCYRFESDKKKVSAVAAWGNEETGSHLKNIFETLWKSAKPVKIYPCSDEEFCSSAENQS